MECPNSHVLMGQQTLISLSTFLFTQVILIIPNLCKYQTYTCYPHAKCCNLCMIGVDRMKLNPKLQMGDSVLRVSVCILAIYI